MSDRRRTHHHARAARLEQGRNVGEQRPKRHPLHARLFGAHQQHALRALLALILGTRQRGDETVVDLRPRQPLVLVRKLAELRGSLFERHAREAAERLVEQQLAAHKVEIYALLEAAEHVLRGNFAVAERSQHKFQTALAALLDNLLVAAPIGDVVEVLLNVGKVLDLRAQLRASAPAVRAIDVAERRDCALVVFVRIDIVLTVQIGTVLGQRRTALLKQLYVEVGVQVRRRAVELLNRVAILGNRLGVCVGGAEHRGQLLVQFARHAARLLAASEIAEEGLPLLLGDAVGHNLAQFARRALAVRRVGEVVLRHFRRVRAVPRAVVGHHHRRLVAEVEIVVDKVFFVGSLDGEIVRRIILAQPERQAIERLELLVGQRHRTHAVIG